MQDTITADALRLAIKVLRDVAASHKMPSGVALDKPAAEPHAHAGETSAVIARFNTAALAREERAARLEILSSRAE